ncbi:DotD/TraH family lipoprotein [Serratia proteamaculans]|uniref:DotD/TraH family lipoprotein n=1 Tax=Serratia proteamaculans TaxID=28151 RepID=UPI0039AEA332
MKISCMLFFLPVVLSGCQLPAKSTAVMPLQDTDVQYNAQEIQNTQTTLYFSGVINQKKSTLFTPGISANSQRVSVDWDGDAIELLSQLAHQRGLTFAYTGVRLPLPVTVHIQNVTFENLLRIIRAQIDWRAQLDQQSTELRLYFMLPLKKGKLA